jgi:PKD repeat protein
MAPRIELYDVKVDKEELSATLTVSASDPDGDELEVGVEWFDADSKPVITLKGDNPLTITVGEEYVDPGATAYDEEDGDLSDQIVITGTVDTSTPGEYTVTYTVRDSAGNTATATRVVKVVEPDPTYTLSLLGQEPSAGAKISPDIGDSFTQVWELKLTANHDATLSLSPITGSCDLKILDDDKAKDLQVEEGESFEAAVIYETPTADGNYTCLFEVKDSEGHSYTVDGEDYLVTFIHLVTKPLAVNTDLDTQVQVGTDATLLVQVNSGNPPYQISIDWGDGEVTATSFSAQSASYAHAYNEAGTYTVTVELTDAASKSYRRVYTVEVYEEVPLQSEWEGVVDPVHSDGSSGPEQGVEIIAEPIDGVDGMATYSLDYELGSGDLFYYAGYKLPVPQGLITLDKKVRVSYLLQIDTSTGLWEYDREHWLKSDAKKFGVVIEDFHDGTNLDGVWIVKDLAEGTERRETVAEFVDEVVSHGGYSGYALEIDGGKLTVYRYDQRDDGSFTGSMTQVRSFDVGAGEYLTQLHVDTKGPSKLIYAKIEYDLNGDGDYEDANESLDLTTLTKSVDWSRFDLGKEDEPIPVATSRLKKTGQTKSYDQDGNEVERCAVKDDGCYQAGVDPRYTRDDATGIVTDHVTGLQWQDDYSDNGGKVKMATWEDAVAYCESLKLGGYGDWSLPEIYELETLFDYGKRMPAVDAIFKNLQSFDYWSSTEFVANADYYAWQARFSSGVTGFFTDKYSPYPYVMCKREK